MIDGGSRSQLKVILDLNQIPSLSNRGRDHNHSVIHKLIMGEGRIHVMQGESLKQAASDFIFQGVP